MREDDTNWFSKWQEELPSPEELMPISQSLITADLASVFDIRASPLPGFHHHHQSASSPQLFGGGNNNHNYGVDLQLHQQQSSSTPQPPHNSSEFDSSSAELCGGGSGGGGGGGSDEPARTLKRPRLVWTPQLHKRFVDAVAHLGIKNAVPKTIMQLMSVDGLTRENVASHLQKYRLYLKRMQSINNGGGGGHGGGNGPGSDEDHLFASSPVPAHFLHQVATVANTGPGSVVTGGGVRPNSEQFMQYMPVASLHHQHLTQTRIQAQTQTQTQAHYDHHRQMVGHFGLAHQTNGQFDHPFLSRQAQLGPNRNGMESSTPNNNRKALTLFPTADE